MSAPKPAEIEKRQLERLIFFSDAVFAIAITLLVLDLRLPANSKGVVDMSLLGDKLFGFVLSFAVIGVYWLYHHQLFAALVREDAILRIVNLVFLATIVFLPFPTSVIAEFPATRSSVVLYALSVASVGLLITALSLACERRTLRDPEARSRNAGFLATRALVAPTIFIVSAVVALARPHLAMQLWWLIAPASWAIDHLGKATQAKRKTPAPAPAETT